MEVCLRLLLLHFVSHAGSTFHGWILGDGLIIVDPKHACARKGYIE